MLTPLQFLSQVREWLSQVMADTQIDYIAMTRTSINIKDALTIRVSKSS